MKFLITKEVKKVIGEMARLLPPVPTGKKVPLYKAMYGSQIIAEMERNKKKGPFMIEVNGKNESVKPDKRYNIKMSDVELYNHTVELTKAWKIGGHPACQAYILKTKQLAANKKEPKTEELEIGEVVEDISFNADGSVTYNTPMTFSSSSIKEDTKI